MATSDADYSGYYKPGGIMGGVMGRYKARVIESGHDKYGRWVWFRMSGQSNRTITVIGTYQVCQDNVRTAGATTAITQKCCQCYPSSANTNLTAVGLPQLKHQHHSCSTNTTAAPSLQQQCQHHSIIINDTKKHRRTTAKTIAKSPKMSVVPSPHHNR